MAGILTRGEIITEGLNLGGKDPKKAKQKFKEHLGEIKELQKMDYKKRKDRIGK